MLKSREMFLFLIENFKIEEEKWESITLANLNEKMLRRQQKRDRESRFPAAPIRDVMMSDDGDATNYIRMWNVWTKSGARATT